MSTGRDETAPVTSEQYSDEAISEAVSIDGVLGASESARAVLGQAMIYWSNAEFERCIQHIDTLSFAKHTSESVLLRARALLRLQKVADAEKWLRMMEACHTTEDAIATHAMLLGTACARLDEFDRATVLFNSVASATPHSTIVAEAAYFHALALWRARDFAAARTVLQPAIAADHDFVSARARQLMGFIAVAQGRYAEAHGQFNVALETLDSCVTKDMHLEATLIYQLAIGAAEIDLHDATRIDELAHKFPWTTDLLTEHVQTLRHLGIAYARMNQPRVALARFLEASEVKPQSEWSIFGLAEAANLLRQFGESVGANGFLYRSRQIAGGAIHWDGVEGEGRLSLLLLAMAVARSGDGDAARKYLDLYRRDGGLRLNELSALHLDSRVATYERHAEGVVRAALGYSDAQEILSDAATGWRRMEYLGRAQEARDDIRAMNQCSYDFRATTTHYSDDPSVTIQAPRRISVTKQQDRILRQLVKGRTTSEIAETLALGPKTIQNHLGKLYGKFQVADKAQLIALIGRDPELRAALHMES